MADQQQQPQMTDEEREYRQLIGEVANSVYRDIQIAKQVAVKAFGADVKPEVTMLVYDRIFERANEIMATPGDEQPG